MAGPLVSRAATVAAAALCLLVAAVSAIDADVVTCGGFVEASSQMAQ
jgi:hypothetical protein